MLDSSFRILKREDLDRVLDSLDNVSDYFFCDNEPLRAKIQGRVEVISPRDLDPVEIERVITVLGDEAGGLYQNLKTVPEPRDRSYVTQSSNVRYRVNLAVNSAKSRKSFRITMRRLESEPWELNRLRIPPGLLDAAFAKQTGLILVLGATGSGKTSMLGGILRAITSQPDASGHLVTIEDPVEYTYDKTANPNYVVTQMEVGVGCRSFADGMRAAVRQHPDQILIGEIRDNETAAAAIAAARSGHQVYATMHVSSVAEAFQRWSDFFPQGAEHRAMNDLATVLNYAVYQTLEHTELGYMPVQESLSLMNCDRPKFVEMIGDNLDGIYRVMDKYVRENGIPHAQDRLSCNPSQAQLSDTNSNPQTQSLMEHLEENGFA